MTSTKRNSKRKPKNLKLIFSILLKKPTHGRFHDYYCLLLNRTKTSDQNLDLLIETASDQITTLEKRYYYYLDEHLGLVTDPYDNLLSFLRNLKDSRDTIRILHDSFQIFAFGEDEEESIEHFQLYLNALESSAVLNDCPFSKILLKNHVKILKNLRYTKEKPDHIRKRAFRNRAILMNFKKKITPLIVTEHI